MNQQQPQGMPPYNPNNPPRGNFPPPQGTVPNGYGQPMNRQQGAGNPQMANPQGPQPKQGNNQSKNKKKKTKKQSGSIVGWVFLGIFLMIALAIGGGYLGYKSAINAREAEYTRKSRMAAAEQYQMALADIEQGKFNNAQTRLNYVLEVDQNYPGAFEKLQEVHMALYPTASPTPMMTATPQPTATTDTRGEEEVFQAIQQAMYSQNWEYAITLITTLRDRNLSYRGIEVDGMYYIALRNYGIQQINAGYLENGIYNITLAESFGPIDNNAENMRAAARSYLSGAGFWEINWSKALEYYSNAASVYPALFDRATMLSANQRFAEASFMVAAEYIAREDFCGAIPFYEQGLPITSSESVQMTATAVYLICYPPQPTDEPDAEPEFYDPEEYFPGDFNSEDY